MLLIASMDINIEQEKYYGVYYDKAYYIGKVITKTSDVLLEMKFLDRYQMMCSDGQ
jgi:hypothetical protein